MTTPDTHPPAAFSDGYGGTEYYGTVACVALDPRLTPAAAWRDWTDALRDVARADMRVSAKTLEECQTVLMQAEVCAREAGLKLQSARSDRTRCGTGRQIDARFVRIADEVA